MTEQSLAELIELYRKWANERSEAIDLAEVMKYEIKKRRTEIASQVLSEVDEKGRKKFSNDMMRSTEIDKRAFMDKEIEQWQNTIWEMQKTQREAEREMKIIEWIIEAKIRSPKVM